MKTSRHLGILGLGLVLGGCAKTADSRIEIKYMAWGNPQQLALEKKLCEEFNQKQTRIRARLFQVPQSAYGNKMIVMLASDTAPDVMRVDQYVFPALVKKSYFRSLADLIKKDPTYKADEFFPASLAEGIHKGARYGFNVLFGGVLVYYNKTLFQKAGLPDPFEQFERGEWTWDAYLSAAKRLTVKDEKGKVRQFGTAIPPWPTYLSTVWSLGGEIMDPTQTQVLLGKGGSNKVWQFWYDVRYKHKAAPTPSQAANSAFSFESGKLGMTFEFMGMTPRYRASAKGFDWDVVPIPGPAIGNRGYTLVKGNQLVMWAKCKHPEAAYEFMRFMTSQSVEKLLAADMRRTFPARKAVAFSPEYQKPNQPPYNIKAFTYAVETGRPLPITSRWGQWTGEFNSGLEALFNGQTTDVAKTVAEAQSRAEKVLATPEGL